MGLAWLTVVAATVMVLVWLPLPAHACLCAGNGPSSYIGDAPVNADIIEHARLSLGRGDEVFTGEALFTVASGSVETVLARVTSSYKGDPPVFAVIVSSDCTADYVAGERYAWSLRSVGDHVLRRGFLPGCDNPILPEALAQVGGPGSPPGYGEVWTAAGAAFAGAALGFTLHRRIKI